MISNCTRETADVTTRSPGTGRSWASPHTPAQARSILVLALVALMVLQVLAFLPASEGPAGTVSAASGRIVVVSNETSIPLALGTPSTGLTQFNNILTNMRGVHITGQVVDGDYTPIWQSGSVNNHPIPDALVHWSFGNEADRAHSTMADQNGYFSLFITPVVSAPATASLRFWFDGKADTVYGIPIYPAARITYTIFISESVILTVRPVQDRAMAGDTILVQGSLKGPDGDPISDEGLMALFDGQPAALNPYPGWFVDNVAFGPIAATFEEGLEGFTSEGKGTWSSGTPTAGPNGCSLSFRCAGASLGGNYPYDIDSWLTSPIVDLTTYDSAMLTFDSWSDISPEDELVVELSNDNGITWPVRLSVTSGPEWGPVSFHVKDFLDTPYGQVGFAHKPDIKFRFRLIGHTTPLRTDADGNYEFTYTVPAQRAAGPATVRVEHPATKDFAATASSAEVHIARWTKVQTVSPDQAFRGTPVEIRGQLLDADGTPIKLIIKDHTVPTPTVRFWLRQGENEAYLGERAISSDGYAAIGFQASSEDALGPAQVRYAFPGNEFYSPTQFTRDITLKAHTEIEITSPKVASLLAQDSLDIEGIVRLVRFESSNDVTQDPVVRKDVQVLIDGSEVGITTTDDEGRFLFVYDVKGSGINLGNAAISVVFPGDLVYERSESTVDFSILSNTSIQAQPKYIQKGTTAIIDGTLTSIHGGLQGIVELEIDGSFYRKVVTSPSGKFATNYDVPWTTENGPLQITLTYKGTRVYRPSTVTLTYVVESETTVVVPKELIVAHRGTGVTIRGALVESINGVSGTPVPSAQVELILPDGTKATALTNPNGNFTHYFTLPDSLSVGDTEAIVTYSGLYRGSSMASVPIQVSSATSLTFAEVSPSSLTENAQALIRVALTDDRGSPVAGRDILLVSDRSGVETILFQGPTDSSGALTIRTYLNTTGPHTLKARFEGDAHYDPAETAHFLTVGPAKKTVIPLTQQPTVVLGGGLSLVLILSIIMTESGKYFLFKLVLVPMYSKLKKEDVLDHFVRGQIYGLIRMQPGAHYNFIKQKLDLSNGVLSYHLSTLEREGYILSESDGIYKRFFPNHVKFEVDYPIFLSKLQERIVDFIKSRPGLTQKEVAKELGISTSTANDNILVLNQAKIIDLKRDGKRTRCFIVES